MSEYENELDGEYKSCENEIHFLPFSLCFFADTQDIRMREKKIKREIRTCLISLSQEPGQSSSRVDI